LIFVGPDGFVYTGLADGRIVRFDPQNLDAGIEGIIHTGDPMKALPLPCGTYETESICGRPLGLEFHPKSGLLIVADTVGLISVDVKAKTKQLLISRAGNSALKFINDLAIHPVTGLIYFTDSSTIARKDAALTFLQGGTDGRLVVYDPTKKTTTVLLTDLHFPNGLVWGCEYTCLLFAETTRSRVLKFDEPSRILTVAMDDLPVYPDGLSWVSTTSGLEKIKQLDKETTKNTLLWVGGNPRRAPFSLTQWLWPYARLRALIGKLLPVNIITALAPREALLLLYEVSPDGHFKLLRHLDGESEIAFHVSGALQVGRRLFVGSYDPAAEWIATLELESNGE
jgi:hypothetical protein